MKYILSLPWPYVHEINQVEEDHVESYFQTRGLKCKYIPDMNAEYRYAVVAEEEDVTFLKIIFPKIRIIPKESYLPIHLRFLDEISKSK